MKLNEFEKVVEVGFSRLPEWVRLRVKNVAILIEDEPSPQVRAVEKLGPDETLLGYYQGIPLSERGENYGVGIVMPDTISLYRFPILEAAHETGVSVEDIVADTIWHEFGHHFGLDEHGVQSKEKERGVGDYRQAA